MRYAVAVVSPCGVWRYLRDDNPGVIPSHEYINPRFATAYLDINEARDTADNYRKTAGHAYVCVVDLDSEWRDSYAD